jgi:long-subunit acyl-CoA synthetase (AMP-forming)
VRGKTVLSSLPVAGIARLGASLAALSRGAKLLLPDPVERPDAGLGEHPTNVVLLDVTSLERLFRAWSEDIEAKSWIGQSITRWALREGRAAQRDSWRHRLAEVLVLRGLRAKLGGRASGLDVIAVGGGRASDEVNLFFEAAGLSLRYFSPVTGAPLAR